MAVAWSSSVQLTFAGAPFSTEAELTVALQSMRLQLAASPAIVEEATQQRAAGGVSSVSAEQLARESLHAVPSFTSREVVMLSASLSTCDPGDIYATAAALKRDKLRTSIFSLSFLFIRSSAQAPSRDPSDWTTTVRPSSLSRATMLAAVT